MCFPSMQLIDLGTTFLTLTTRTSAVQLRNNVYTWSKGLPLKFSFFFSPSVNERESLFTHLITLYQDGGLQRKFLFSFQIVTNITQLLFHYTHCFKIGSMIERVTPQQQQLSEQLIFVKAILPKFNSYLCSKKMTYFN